MAGESDWTLTWTALINAQAIADGNSFTSGSAISNDGVLDTEVAVKVAYGATVDTAARVYVLRETADGYEAIGDDAWGFPMPSSVSGTHYRTFTVPASVGRFKVAVENSTGAQVTADVDYRQSVAA